MSERRERGQVDGHEFHGPRDYLELARSPDATATELEWLAASEYRFVWEAVADHPNTPARVLADLVGRAVADPSLFRRVATNPNTTADICRSLAASVDMAKLHTRSPASSFDALVSLFEQPHAPVDALLRLLDDPRATTQFRKVVARETVLAEVIDHLRHDRSETVRRSAERREPTGSKPATGPKKTDQ